MAKLKVFTYSDGFHAWTVAASSRAKALAAFGVKRDLFADGSAKQIDKGPDHDAALEAPGELIERGLAVDIGEVSRSQAPRPRAAKGSSQRDKARVAALEGELDELDRTHETEREALEDRRAALEREAAQLARAQQAERDKLKTRLKAARAKLS